jgi:hypothetical protein
MQQSIDANLVKIQGLKFDWQVFQLHSNPPDQVFSEASAGSTRKQAYIRCLS